MAPGGRPGGPRPPIDHVVVVVKENRTYDMLLGGTPASRGPGPLADLCLPSRAQALRPTVPAYCNRRFPPKAVPVYRALARRFTVATRYWSEVRGPSDPNHYMLMSAQSPLVGNRWAWQPTPDMETLADRFTAAGLTWRNYAGYPGAGFGMVAHLARAPQQRRWEDFASDAAAGTLPALSWVTPPFPRSDHPPAPIAWGEAWTAHQVSALWASPCWARTAAFLLWDDWGGFGDRLPPPVVELWRDGRPFRYGRRVPLLVLSPFARPGLAYGLPASHVSIPAFCEAVFGLPALTFRDAEANPLLGCFDWDAPQAAPPPLTVPPTGLQERLGAPLLALGAELFRLVQR